MEQIWTNTYLKTVTNDTIKVGDIVARDPMVVLPVIDVNDNLLRITGTFEVKRITNDGEYINVSGEKDCYKRLIGKPIYKLVII